MARDARRPQFDALKFKDINYLKRLMEAGGYIGERMENFLATGNLISKTNLDVMQTSGFTIVADKLNNIRYLSHFRAIHRGQYFAEQKTTTVRKLLPEAWGFLCPVHTPDGAPCGLLNHISLACVPLPDEAKIDIKKFSILLTKLGMSVLDSGLHIPISLDGQVLGSIDPKIA